MIDFGTPIEKETSSNTILIATDLVKNLELDNVSFVRTNIKVGQSFHYRNLKMA